MGELLRIVVLGAKGFVGSYLAADLASCGQVQGLTRAEADLGDPGALRRALRPGDVVVNAAGYARATDTSKRGRQRFQSDNVDGVGNLARVALEVGVSHLIHLSSVAAMGRWEGSGIREEQYLPTDLPYAASKRVGEQVLEGYKDRLSITILRPTSVFGPGRGLAAVLCRVVARGVVPLPGAGQAEIPFTYIGNVSHAVKLCIANPACYGRTFIVGDTRSYSLREVVRAIGYAFGKPPRIIPIPLAVATVGTVSLEALSKVLGREPLMDRARLYSLTHSVSYSVKALQEATGYTPPFSLEAAAQRLVEWYRLGEGR